MDKQDSVTVYIAVMDYCSGSIKMYTKECKKGWQTEDIEDWLVEYTDYSNSQCYYMASENPIAIEYPEVDETDDDEEDD